MNPTALYGFVLVLAFGLGGALTRGATQTTLFVSAGCALAALMVTAVAERAGDRARDKVLGDHRARYGKDPLP